MPLTFLRAAGCTGLWALALVAHTGCQTPGTYAKSHAMRSLDPAAKSAASGYLVAVRDATRLLASVTSHANAHAAMPHLKRAIASVQAQADLLRNAQSTGSVGNLHAVYGPEIQDANAAFSAQRSRVLDDPPLAPHFQDLLGSVVLIQP